MQAKSSNGMVEGSAREVLGALWSALVSEVGNKPLPVDARLLVWPDPLVVAAVCPTGVVWRRLASQPALAPAVAAFLGSGMTQLGPEPRRHLAQVLQSGHGVLVIDADPVRQSAAAVLVTGDTSFVVFSLRTRAN